MSTVERASRPPSGGASAWLGRPDEHRGSDLLVRPTIWAAALLPAAAAAGYVAAAARVTDATLFVTLLGLVALLVTVSVVRPWAWASSADDARARRVAVFWQAFALALATGLTPVLLNAALEIEVQVFSGLFVLVLVLGVHAFAAGLRALLLAWTLTTWLLTLWWGGVHEPELLLLHLGGGLLAIVATHRSSDVLSRSLRGEAAQRQDAERWARLLGSVGKTNSLDPDEVLRATVDGLLEIGFSIAAIRELDHEAHVARLVEGAARMDVSLVEEVDLDDGEFSAVVDSGRPSLIRRADRDPRNRRHLPVRDLLYLPLFDDGAVHATVSAGSSHEPITDQMLAAAELLAEQASDALARARAHREDTRTVAELRRLDERTQDFVSTVSHELRTPLTVVQGLGRTLLDRWHDLTPDQRRDLLDRIEANADRLGAMVRSLLDTSAMESGALQLAPTAVEVGSTVDALRHRLGAELDDHPVDVDVEPGLAVKVDRGLFEHVLENLVTNAVKHTAAGTPITVSARRQHERAVVLVRDEGQGIAADDLPHVLERFYRGGEPTRRTAGGLGLGLALAREVVEAHGGQLGVVSRLDEGTVFSFDVPLAD